MCRGLCAAISTIRVIRDTALQKQTLTAQECLLLFPVGAARAVNRAGTRKENRDGSLS